MLGVPVTPSPRTLKTAPESGLAFISASVRPALAVVTYISSILGPPKQTDVTCSAGMETDDINLPVSGSMRNT